MRIKHLSTAVMEANFDWTIVKVEGDNGVTGYGEAFVGPGVPAIIREFAPLVVGEDATSIERLMRRLRGVCIYASPGVVRHALAGIETAIFDALGKTCRMPLWQMLGGKFRDAVAIYADCHGGADLDSITPLLVPRTPRWAQKDGDHTQPGVVSLKHHGWDASRGGTLDPAEYAQHAARAAQDGFRILKFDIDVPMPYETDEYNRSLSGAEVEYAAALAMAARKAVGPEVELAIDCHWNYGVQTAIALAQALEPCRLLWLEDPVPPENIAAIGTVQRATRTTITTGENHYHRLDFERLITEGGLRLLAPDVQKIGIIESKKLADLADLHYVNLTWHNISGPVGTLAGVHVSAATPNLIALEYHAASVPFFDALRKGAEGPLIRGGRIQVPDAPGLGVELDEDVAYRYRKPGESFFGDAEAR
ncbi:MAG: mandelate racemase/muconate lactonizing enzyme family protein [Acidobacteriota bacterium]|nr:mandelate racemase/muconate lactonizing enzyme family protein [Acidobacteriota bacterium]